METVVAAAEQLFESLGREPDFDAPELQAHDSADLLILDTAAESLRAARPGEVAIIGDRHGALTLGVAELFGMRGIRTHQDPLLGERALTLNAGRLGFGAHFTSRRLDATLVGGARVVLVQLPRGLDALEEIAWTIARYADPAVRVFAGGRVKHMTRAQNDVFAQYFSDVSAGLGWRKARVLEVGTPHRPADPPFPRWASDAELTFSLASFGATFGGSKLDHGSRLLLSTLRTHAPAVAPIRVLDLGCGNGVLAVSAALTWPTSKIVASDQSDAAVRATALTAQAAGVSDRVAIHRADGTEALDDESVDLVLLNPPFHTGSTVHAGVAHRLIRDCQRVLAPGGELRLVFNSHLGYRRVVTDSVGPVRQLARDKTFTVLSTIRS
ncbi:MAG: class I SAM-dependent methyltransferase [Leucobacter sp.]